MSNMIEVIICIGTSCHLNGSYNVSHTFQQLIEEFSLHEKIDFKAYFCMKKCDKKGVSVIVDGEAYRVEPENARTFFESSIIDKFNLVTPTV
jgi:NADH:ubiquinone oxidoreductase subunit E